MQFCKFIIRFGVIGASIVAASLPARALVITYTDRDAFLAALSSSSTDNYNDLSSAFVTSPLNRTITGYTYNATAIYDLFPGTVNGSTALSANASDTALTLNFTAGAPTAVGGYFFNTDVSFNVVNSVITVTANPGASA